MAIQKGTQGFIREFVQTSYDVVSTGYVDYTDSKSNEKGIVRGNWLESARCAL